MKLRSKEKIMEEWDMHRNNIANGKKCSSPRDWFESYIDFLIEATQWQPIETAPMDGTELLLKVEKKIVIGRCICFDNYEYEWVIGDDNETYIDNPTHWLPLPEMPE